MVVIISTYHFTRDNENTECPTVFPSDCTVQFKYSSTEFKSANAEEENDKNAGFNFDKNGLVFPYPMFVALMRSAKFHAYLSKCVERKARDDQLSRERRSQRVFSGSASSSTSEIVVDEEEEMDQGQSEANLPLKRKQQKPSKQASPIIEGSVKRFKVPAPPPPSPPSTKRPTEHEISARISEAVKVVRK